MSLISPVQSHDHEGHTATTPSAVAGSPTVVVCVHVVLSTKVIISEKKTFT